MIRLLERIFCPERARERQRIEVDIRARTELEKLLCRYRDDVTAAGVRPYLPARRATSRPGREPRLGERAAEQLPVARSTYAEFRSAYRTVDAKRARLRDMLDDPDTPSQAVAWARPFFDAWEKHHPSPARMQSNDAEWLERIAQLERWASTATVSADRGREHPGEVIFDRGDRMHAGWWHGP